MLYIGLDVHQVQTMVFWVDTETGETSGQAYSVPTPEIADHLPQSPGPKRCVLEGGSCSWFVTQALESYDAAVCVVDAFKARRVIEGYLGLKKTDKIDARGLALASAHAGLEHAAIWQPDPLTARLRELTRSRTRLVAQSVCAQNHLRKFLGRLGRPCPYTRLLGKNAGRWLDALEPSLGAELRWVLQSLRRTLAHLQGEVEALSQRVVECAGEHPDYALLQTLPGLGPQLAASVAAEIGAIGRFPAAKELRGYSGLVPQTHQSGQRCHHGPLTKAGNRYLRRAIVLAAQLFARHAATRDLRPRRWHAQLVYRRGTNPAKVALARRLMDIIYAMLRDRTPFDPDRHRLAAD